MTELVVEKPIIRILHLVSGLDKGSGVMSVIMNYYRHIDRNLIQFDFCYFVDSDNSYKSFIEDLGGETYKISKPSLNFNYVNELRSIFATNNYAILHLHEVYLVCLISSIAKKTGIKHLITHAHATKYSDKRTSAIRNWILVRPLKKCATEFVACSKAAGKFLYGEKYLLSGKVTIVKNAISCDEFKFTEQKRKKIRSEFDLKDEFIVGHVGRFNPQKNHSFIIDVFYEIVQKRSDAVLMLVGQGPLEKDIRKKVNDLGLIDNVIFLGKRNDVSDVLCAFDSFLMPSLFEGLPVVGVEVQAMGLPTYFSSKITNEIGLVNYMYLDLKFSSKYWASKILNNSNVFDRLTAVDVIKDYGYDIKVESKRLEEYYFNLLKD